jgi:hypothetical protein
MISDVDSDLWVIICNKIGEVELQNPESCRDHMIRISKNGDHGYDHNV